MVSDEEFERAAEELGEELRGHIAFAQDQVRGFARAQRATMSELEVEMGPGVVLGHRHIPVGAVGAYVPGGRYPMLASSFMTVLVAKVAGVGQVVGCAPPQRRRDAPGDALRDPHLRADAVLCLGGVQGLAAMAFGLIDGLAPVDMLVGAGLPTSRAARYTGGLWVGKFLKTCTYQRVSQGPGGWRRRRPRSRMPSTSRAAR